MIHMKSTFKNKNHRSVSYPGTPALPAAAILLFIAVSIFSLSSFLFGKVQVSADPERPVRILCYGDSNTYGFDPDPNEDRYPENVRWTGVLQEKLGENYQIIEEGRNGRTAGYRLDATPMYPEEGPEDLTARLENHQPVDILVIMLGTNDCLPALGLSAEDITDGIDVLIRAAEDWADQNGTARPSFVIIAPPVMDDDILDTPYATPKTEEYIRKARALPALYSQLAEAHGGIFVDACDSIELSPLDQVHLTEKGHAQLAELLAHALHDTRR